MDLSNLEQRKQYIEQLGKDFIQDLRDAGLVLSEKAFADICQNRIEVGTSFKDEGQMDWACQVNLYFSSNNEEPLEKYNHRCKMNIGSSGGFDPVSNEIQRWRYIHAGQLASKWDLVVPILDKYQNLINELMKIEVEK